ncbi:unnamed protein product [Didymodactylos carnosus]|uniref:Uncharacterized protein n=1 Tax=Didymodactylos carnosus TaxID=1234261 RepID=A0A814IUR5_9BILA|nr:unnamed protein product [Didymodactylos carnosus]CAF1028757.1 unnamed protein product [Didymodactylos carnosus]CAF3620008.1 unnamed protein product [Didymodactylos carnosus]CAF3799742.1 unnamed protein product [Didymodactylos carnosus]
MYDIMFAPPQLGSTLPTPSLIPLSLDSTLPNFKDSTYRNSKLSATSSSSKKHAPNPDLLRELNARYLHDINIQRAAATAAACNDPQTSLLVGSSPYLRAEHYHQHTHTHEHNLNILTPSSTSTTTSAAITTSTSNINPLLDKLSKPDGLSPFLRTSLSSSSSMTPTLTTFPSILTPFGFNNNSNGSPSLGSTGSSSSKDLSSPTSSSISKKPGKWCAAHVRISWLIYKHQQRTKSSDKDDNTVKNTSLLPDLLSSTTKNEQHNSSSLSPYQTLPPPLPSSAATSLFNYRPFDFSALPNGVFPPPNSLSVPFPGRTGGPNAFGGLGSLFPDRKDNSMAAGPSLGLDWTRYHRGLGPLMPPYSNKPPDLMDPTSMLAKKMEEERKRQEDDRDRTLLERERANRLSMNNSTSDRIDVRERAVADRLHHPHLSYLPSHLTNNSTSSTNRSRSRSPHHNQNHKDQLKTAPSPLTANLSESPLTSSNKKQRNSPSVKSESISTTPSRTGTDKQLLPPSLPPSLNPLGLDPLMLSILERQRVSAAYASLFSNPFLTPPSMNERSPYGGAGFWPGMGGPDRSPQAAAAAMAAAEAYRNLFDARLNETFLQQREHFLSLAASSGQPPTTTTPRGASLPSFSSPETSRLYQENYERERLAYMKAAALIKDEPKTNGAVSSPKLTTKIERFSPPTVTNTSPKQEPLSPSSSTSSKKSKKIKKTSPVSPTNHTTPTMIPLSSSTTISTNSLPLSESNTDSSSSSDIVIQPVQTSNDIANDVR